MRLVLYLAFLILAAGTAVIATPLLVTYYEHGITGVAALVAPGIPHNLTLHGGSRIFLPVGAAGNQTVSSASRSMAELMPIYIGGNSTLAGERILKMLTALSGLKVQIRISISGAALYMAIDNGSGIENEVVPLDPTKLSVAGYVSLLPNYSVRFVIKPGRPWVVLNFTFAKTAPTFINISANTIKTEGIYSNITSYAEHMAKSVFHGKLRGLAVWCDLRYVIKARIRNSQLVIQTAYRLLQEAVIMPAAFGACTIATYMAYKRLLRPRVREG